MRLGFIATGSLLLLGVAACAPAGYTGNNVTGTTATGANAASAASTAPNAASQMPQNTNALPQGAAVNAPVQSRMGQVGKTAY